MVPYTSWNGNTSESSVRAVSISCGHDDRVPRRPASTHSLTKIIPEKTPDTPKNIATDTLCMDTSIVIESYHSPPILYLKKSPLNLPPVARQI